MDSTCHDRVTSLQMLKMFIIFDDLAVAATLLANVFMDCCGVT